nr:MAG TPA_asm: hypothetical protein [Bacteriophage sp.]
MYIDFKFNICYNANRQKRCEYPCWYSKSPGGTNSGAFLFRLGRVAYSLGWLPLLISIQPFANVVGNYTRQNRE